MPTLVSDVVNSVINLLSQVPGFVTQTYAGGRILQHVQDALLLEFEEMFWPTYTMPFIVEIDPVTGVPTQDMVGPISTIDEWRDIMAVFPKDSNQKLSELPQGINFTLLDQAGTPRFVAAHAETNRPFSVWPHGGPVLVWARQRPVLPLKLTDKLYLDHLLIQYDACWMYAVDDGTIPAQVNKFQVLAQNRRRMVKASLGQHPLALDPRHGGEGIPQSEWDGGYFVLDEDPLA
jgi:hypothetical protein